MSAAIKSTAFGVVAALMLLALPQAKADGGHGRWDRDWRPEHHRHFDHGWRHRHDHDRVLVIREPRHVYRERAYIIDEPYYYSRRPSLVIGLDVPPLVVGF